METTKDQLSSAVIGAGIDVHRALGPGLDEGAYMECLARDIEERGLRVRRQVSVPIVYKGVDLGGSCRIDLVVEERLAVGVKAVDEILHVHEAEVLTYLRMSGTPVGLLLNFNSPVLKDGIKRFVNRHASADGREPGS
jgi:GxxExxY protein